MHCQQQVLLCNSNSAEDAFSQLARVMIRWHRHGNQFVIQSLPPLIVSGIVFVAWAISWIYVPYIYTHMGSSVLLAQSTLCGILELTVSPGSLSEFNFYLSNPVDDANQAKSYVQQC